MIEEDARLAGVIPKWPSKSRMATILQDAGLTVRTGEFSLRIEECSHFVLQHYGGDVGEPVIDADAESVERMVRDGEAVSAALSKAKVAHRFEVYDGNDKLVRTLTWPPNG